MNITDEERKQLQLLHDTGYAFNVMLKSMPDHISIEYASYFKDRGRRKTTTLHVARFISATKAILNNTTPEEWNGFWNKNKPFNGGLR